MKVAEDSLAHVRSVYDKVKAQVDSAPRDDGTLLEKRKELQREVDVTKRTLAQQVIESILIIYICIVINLHIHVNYIIWLSTTCLVSLLRSCHMGSSHTLPPQGGGMTSPNNSCEGD